MQLPVLISPRGTGITDWILRASISNPKVTIVFLNENMIHAAKGRISELYQNLAVGKDPINRLTTRFPEVQPEMITMKEYQQNMNVYYSKERNKNQRPVIFDNSCFSGQLGTLFICN